MEARFRDLVEGRNNDTFYVVSKGMVEVVLHRPNQSDVIPLQLGPGKYFGEIAFFHDRKSRASVRAAESGPVEVLALSYDQLNEMVIETYEIWREVLAERADDDRRGTGTGPFFLTP